MTLCSRFAKPEDYAAYVRAFAELRVPDPPRPRDRWLRDMLPTTLFFESEGELVAYAFFQTLRSTGYVRNLVVQPNARGRGVGRAVMRELRAVFAAAGCSTWCLNVKPDNVAAIRVYEAVGMQPAYLSRSLRVSKEVTARLPLSSNDTRVEPLSLFDDEAVERLFAIERGLLSARRRSPEVRQLVARDATGVVGVGSYDLERTAVPFAARDVGAAKALLEALQPMAAGGTLQLVVHANADVEASLLEAGAAVMLETLHYRGEV